MGERGAIVKSSHLLDGCYLGQLQCTLQPGHGGNLKIATLEWVPGGRGKNVQSLNEVNYRVGAKANLTEITSPERLASSICKCVDAVVS